MNKIFKVVWSKSRSMFVVASEMATAHGGGSSEKSSCRSHADESLAHATRALKLKALVVAVCAAGGRHRPWHWRAILGCVFQILAIKQVGLLREVSLLLGQAFAMPH